MPTEITYMMNVEELSDFADQMKSIIMRRLVTDGLLPEAEAEEWSKTHTLIGRKKNFFRTVSNLWQKEKESQGHYWIVVGF